MKIILLALVMVFGGSAVMDTTSRDGMMRVLLDESWAGVAYCGSRPTSWVRADKLASWDGEVLVIKPEGFQYLVHELEHERAMRRFGSCSEYRVWQETNALASEAVPFCMSARYEEREGRRSFDLAANEAAYMLAYQYGLGVSTRQAREAVNAGCVR